LHHSELILAECWHFGVTYSYGNAFWDVLVAFSVSFDIKLT